MINKFIGLGKIIKDLELKQTANSSYVRFTLAVERPYNPKAQQKESDFIPCVAWGKSAEFICKYFGKQSRIFIEGSIRTGSYERNGQKVYTTDVYVDKASFVDPKAKSPANNNMGGIPYTAEEPFNEDVPF